MAAEEYGRLDKYYAYLETPAEEYIILGDGPLSSLAAGPRPMDVLDRCRAFSWPSFSTQNTYKINKEEEAC